MGTPIVEYALEWNQNRKVGAVKLRLGDGQEVPVVVGSSADFGCVEAVLRRGPVYLQADGTITAGWLKPA